MSKLRLLKIMTSQLQVNILMLFLALAGCHNDSNALPVILENAVSITVYNINLLPEHEEDIEQTLKGRAQFSLDKDTFIKLMSVAKFNPVETEMWKGSYLVVVKMKTGGKEYLKLDALCRYIKVIGKNGLFYLTNDSQEKWKKILKKMRDNDF